MTIERHMCIGLQVSDIYVHIPQSTLSSPMERLRNTFNVSNGVRQGLVLSLFTHVYIDQLLHVLKDIADDIVILTPVESALNRLKIVDKFLVANDIKFNASKSELLVFEMDPLRGEKQDVAHNNTVIYAKDFARHPGHVVHTGSGKMCVQF